MPILKIASYRVGVAHKGTGGDTRYLFLEPDAAEAGPGSGGVKVYFESTTRSAGRVSGDVIVATIPDVLFRDMYHIVQTERPVFFMWQVDATGEMLESCGVATVEEPTGEGFTDTSDHSEYS